jgi:hypothetical protein
MLDENEKQQVKELCERIAKEQDHHQFSMLIAQLNQLLEQSEVRTDTARNNLSHSSKKVIPAQSLGSSLRKRAPRRGAQRSTSRKTLFIDLQN